MAALASDWLRHFWLLLWNYWRNLTKLDRKQDLNVFYQVCVFRADRKNKMAALASEWPRYFQLLLWTEFKETWQEARSQCPLSSLCFLGWSENKNDCPGWFLKRWHIVLRCTICGPLVLLFLSMCLRGLIIVLYCKIHDLVVHCASLVQSRWPGAPEGGIV